MSEEYTYATLSFIFAWVFCLGLERLLLDIFIWGKFSRARDGGYVYIRLVGYTLFHGVRYVLVIPDGILQVHDHPSSSTLKSGLACKSATKEAFHALNATTWT